MTERVSELRAILAAVRTRWQRRAMLEAIDTEGMIENSQAVELHLREQLTSVPGVVAVRGKGCLIGIEFDGPCAPAHARLLDRKIITGTSSDPNVLRLLPPLITTTAEIDMLVDSLRETAAGAVS